MLRGATKSTLHMLRRCLATELEFTALPNSMIDTDSAQKLESARMNAPTDNFNNYHCSGRIQIYMTSIKPQRTPQ